MTRDKQLIEKAYYETLMTEAGSSHPIQVLGEMYAAEQENPLTDVAFIRFAQGEVYYHHKDFEAAIFKWEKVTGELESWAKKNIADAYFESGALSVAEEMYTAITTEDRTLTTEVALQLFSLYIEQKNFDYAFRIIKGTVSLNPDYQNVTMLARAFYEEQRDWSSAVELAVDELIRTEVLQWGETLRFYIDKGWTKEIAPEQFSNALVAAYHIDRQLFQQLILSFWHSYKNEKYYLAWIQTMNDLIAPIEITSAPLWQEVASLYEETYCELIGGRYGIKELRGIVPQHITNWLKVVDSAHALFASAAVLAWNQLFSSTIELSVVNDARMLQQQAQGTVSSEEALNLFEDILAWTQMNHFEVGYTVKRRVLQLADVKKKRLLVAGAIGNGKSSFVNSVLGENIVGAATSTVVIFNNHERTEIQLITEEEITAIASLEEFNRTMDEKPDGDVCIEFKLPCRFLNKNSLTLIDTPGIEESVQEQQALIEYLSVADGLLFVLDATAPFTDQEQAMFMQIQVYAPNLPVHFLLNKIDAIHSEAEVSRLKNDTEDRVHMHFPSASVFPYSSTYPNSQQLSELAAFINMKFEKENMYRKRMAQLLFSIQTALTHILEQRIQLENELIESIAWNEDILVKLNGLINNLTVLEKEKVSTIRDAYQSIKNDLTKKLTEHIPLLLRDCSSLLNGNSDFRNIHLELNDKMNRKLQEYLMGTALPKFTDYMLDWIANSKEEFVESQSYLYEMGETFNSLYGEERMSLECDFKVLDDWRRDVDKSIRRVQIEDVNILLRLTPAQLLLKSAGKLLGGLQQNNVMLYNQYKKYIETEEYHEATTAVVHMFFEQFDLLEKALGEDIHLFFRNPLGTLKRMVEETHLDIQANRDILSEIKANPEVFQDSVKLFSVRLRQLEAMLDTGKRIDDPIAHATVGIVH